MTESDPDSRRGWPVVAGTFVVLFFGFGAAYCFGAFFAPVSVGFALFIFLLELLVSFLQAYIFTMLTALFIGMSVHVAH